MRSASTARRALKLAAAGTLLLGSTLAHAQYRPQPTPFTVRFDAASLLAERPQLTLPLWLQGVSVRHYRADVEQMQITVVRLDLRRMKSLAPFVELRVGLASGPGNAVVTAWSETGQQIFRSSPFGSLTEATTDTLRVATEGADYVEVELPKNGERLLHLYASAMRYAQILQSVDFSPEPVFDAFNNSATPTAAPEQDRLLWNRVQALLDAGPFVLHPDRPELLEFTISKPPECAVLTFEIRNALPEAPPVLRCNNEDLPGAGLNLPDLADPAWRARPVRGTDAQPMRYTGWIRVQQFIPGDLLQQGANTIEFLQSDSEESEEIRKVDLQLRFRR